jgi:hypothetical protein
MRKVASVLCLIIIFVLPLIAQDDSSQLKISGYAEVYYSYDFSHPRDHLRPWFMYNHNRHNEVNLNIGLLQGTFNGKNTRANLGLMAGTYPEYNLAREGALKAIYEANAGFRVSRHKNLWLDAGILTSHIGFESAIGKDCWNLTRSILADNSPYYESGIRLSGRNRNEKLYFAFLFLNGWQKIKRVPGNQTPAFGTQLTYRPSASLLFNWSTYAGNEYATPVQKWRYFNNFYSLMQITARLGLIAGFDLGIEQAARHSASYHTWYSPVMIARIKVAQKWHVAARAEYYSDNHQVIVQTSAPAGFNARGYSFNIDFAPGSHSTVRLEARLLESSDRNIFQSPSIPGRNFCLSSCVAIAF